MPFIVEDGTGVTNANSYVSIAYADAYSIGALADSAWAALALDTKEKLLIAASRWLDQHAKWNGTKTFTTAPLPNQLRWPRKSVTDCDELPVGENTIPPGLMNAVVDLAHFFINPDNNPLQHSDRYGLKELTVDVITLVFQDGYNANANKYLPGLNSALCGLGRVVSANGARGVPINKV